MIVSDHPISPASNSAWDDQSLVDPHSSEDKARRVHAMFAAIAGSYDRNNRVHSLGRDQAWRRTAVRLAQVKTGEDDVLDMACGTGDLAVAFARACPASVTGMDFVPEMIDHAQRKAESLQGRLPVAPRFRVGDAMNIDLPDGSVDVVSIAFGIRNVAEPEVALSEFHRVLRPGGRLVILEFSEPRNVLLRGLYGVYFAHIMPRTATWISGDRTGAYKYLPRSVSTFASPAVLVQLMNDAGFSEVRSRALTFGICHCHVGRVSSEH